MKALGRALARFTIAMAIVAIAPLGAFGTAVVVAVLSLVSALVVLLGGVKVTLNGKDYRL